MLWVHFFQLQNRFFLSRSSRPEEFCKKGVFRKFRKKTPAPESPFNKVADLRPEACNFIKMRLWHRCFPVYFAKFLKTPFLTEHFRWLLLSLLVLLYSWGTKIRKFITFYFHSIRVARVWRLRSEFGEVGDWHFYQQKQSSSRVL